MTEQMHAPGVAGSKDSGERKERTFGPRQAVVNACREGAWKKVGGVPLAGRLLHQLEACGIKEVVFLARSLEEVKTLSRWQGSMKLRREDAGEVSLPLPAAILSVGRLDQTFLYVDASHLIDSRMIEALAKAGKTTLAFTDRDDRSTGRIRAALLETRDLVPWREEGNEALILRADFLTPEELDPFRPDVRGSATPYFMEVSTDGQAEEATWVLIRSQQKNVMDLPAQYLHPPIANALTYYLCGTPITPNMVTLFGACVGLLVAWLFWHAHFVLGAFLTFAVDILDGVDGKLARTKLQFSKLGRHEDVIDYFYENSWYVALGVGLSSQHPGALPALLACLMVVSDTADNIFYTYAGLWYGKSIDLFSPLDGLFRKIAGRRNIYGAMFIVGFSIGYPLHTFAAAAVWAFITASVHGWRLFRYGRAFKNPEREGEASL